MVLLFLVYLEQILPMRTSEYSEEDKKNIVKVILNRTESIIKSCKKQKISVATYYKWKREVESNLITVEKNIGVQSSSNETLQLENSTLRKLYINLSEHNYELAKFLNNQL